MTDSHEVISSFLDDEPFDAAALVRALGDPEGRELLIDLIALRHLAQTDGRTAPAITHERPRYWLLRRAAVAAAVLLALVSGYAIGERRGDRVSADAPAPTRVVQAPAGWQETPVGRMQ